MPQVTVDTPPAGRLVRDPIYSQLNELLRQLRESSEFKPGDQYQFRHPIREGPTGGRSAIEETR